LKKIFNRGDLSTELEMKSIIKHTATLVMITGFTSGCGVEVHNEAQQHPPRPYPTYLRYTISELGTGIDLDKVLATDCINMDDGPNAGGNVVIQDSRLDDDLSFIWTIDHSDRISTEFAQDGDTITSSTYNRDYFRTSSVDQQISTDEGVDFSFDLRGAGSHCR
jgi:hypothetical protein